MHTNEYKYGRRDDNVQCPASAPCCFAHTRRSVELPRIAARGAGVLWVQVLIELCFDRAKVGVPLDVAMEWSRTLITLSQIFELDNVAIGGR